VSSRFGTEEIPLGPGVAAGAAAWLLGYACTYLVAGPRIRGSGLSRALELLGGEPYTVVGWVFFNSHFVDTTLRGAPIPVATSAIGGGVGLTPLLYALPPALLLGAGFLVGRSRGVETPDRGAVAGVAVVPAYLLLSVLGAALFVVSAGPATGRPDPLLAAVLAGLVYPAAFGAGGGALAGVLRR
jgi:hypothetical protein